MSGDIYNSGRYLLALCLVFLISVAACQPSPVADSNRKEFESLPGAVGYVEGHSDYPELLSEAVERLEKNDIAGAEELYRKLISLEPQNALGYVGLASCRDLQKDLDGAEKYYRQALELDGRSTMAAIGLGSVAIERGRYEEAEKFYLQALSVDQANADAHWGAALACDSEGKVKEAIEHYRKFLELAPNSAQAPAARSRLVGLERVR
jgi:Flp pilus assembly protein TadD